MLEDVQLEEMSVRIAIQKMDDAFCVAMQKAIERGAEIMPTAGSEAHGTKKLKAGAPARYCAQERR
jgi:hypothetical protein